MAADSGVPRASDHAAQSLFWASVWLAIVLVGVKAYYLTVPGAVPWAAEQAMPVFQLLAAISYVDVMFAAGLWIAARAALLLAERWRLGARAMAATFVVAAALAALYAVASIIVYGVLGGFLTYQLLALIGDVGMLRSSVGAYLTPPVAIGLVSLPVVFVALVLATARGMRAWRGAPWPRRAIASAGLIAWLVAGQHAFAVDWTARQERGIADNPHWVLVSSWWRATGGDGTVQLAERFADSDLADFAPIGAPDANRPPARAAGRQRAPAENRAERRDVRPAVVLTGAAKLRTGGAAASRDPPNVVLIVLESVAARWAGLNGGVYESTPSLAAEAARGLVFDNFYAHIGRSSNSLVAMLLSAYPKLDFHDVTERYPRLAGTSLGSVFRDRGYRTAFVTPSDLSWAGWQTFLEGRGFDELRDADDLRCPKAISSWGVEDRCMVDGMIEFVKRAPARPFFMMAWSTQTHHPYEPTPGVPLLNLLREPVPDDYDLGRYLNVLHETDRHLGRFFDTIREAGLDDNTLVVVTGDHGQAFGYPHSTYAQGRTLFQEDVHVPLMFWFPTAYRSPMRSPTVGGHVDLAPTIADLAGIPPAADWQGRSLFDGARPPRTYFYVAGDRFELGVREDNWKYILDLRGGIEQLYDLDRDPTEQHNLAAQQPQRCTRLRQRLAAWTEANRRQYEHAKS
ncbi:MAG: sulfatase-like hydrolase/transferase [Acidobacteriota bacterium]